MTEPLPRVVSLFCGAGGLDLGFHQAGFRIATAFDSSTAAIETYRHNFPRVDAVVEDLRNAGAVGVRSRVLATVDPGSTIGIIGGPPCQGFSRANTSSQNKDPRNDLPSVYLEIVRDLQAHFNVEFVVFENVVGMTYKKHEETYRSFIDGLKALGLLVAERRLLASDFGVPQRRRRLVVCGLKDRKGRAFLEPRRRTGARTVRDAIGHIVDPPLYFERRLADDRFSTHPNHWTMQPRSPRFDGQLPRVDGRSFKRLAWDEESPTVAFGHREIHVHPEGKRRLSIFEALLLQGFPQEFVLKGNLSQQVDQVSNAVPPPLARSLAHAVGRSIRAAGSP